jgi:3-isopropylmalate/(R)-2-methylmalate dehydratase small subunit
MDKKINQIKSTAVPFLEKDVDTDKIAPTEEALYVLSWEEAGDVFCILERQKDKDHVLNNSVYQGARILFAGKNFGCGSSREHATQGTKARYDAVVALSYAPIFEDNAYAIGLPVVKVNEEGLGILAGKVKQDPKTEFKLSLENRTISWGNVSIPISIDDAKRDGFLNGTWDERDVLVGNLSKTNDVLKGLPYIRGYN